MVSHAELCCCGDDVTTCRDCCCSVDYPRAVSDYYTESDGLQGSDDTGKRLFIINACGGGSHDIFVAPELNYFVSLSAFQNYLPVNISNEPLTLIRKDHILTPPYKPPKS